MDGVGEEAADFRRDDIRAFRVEDRSDLTPIFKEPPR